MIDGTNSRISHPSAEFGNDALPSRGSLFSACAFLKLLLHDQADEIGHLLQDEPEYVVGGQNTDQTALRIYDGQSAYTLCPHHFCGIEQLGIFVNGLEIVAHDVSDVDRCQVDVFCEKLYHDIPIRQNTHWPASAISTFYNDDTAHMMGTHEFDGIAN
jgi:hypothetical protein